MVLIKEKVLFLDVDANSTKPVYLGSWNYAYVHDAMVRGDTMWACCINLGRVFVVDVSEKANPVILTNWST